WKKSFRRRGHHGCVFRHVDALPLAPLDSFANLCGGLAIARLLVCVEIFALANSAGGGVLAHITIEQAAMALAAVAVAIAWLLIKNFLDACRNAVSVLSNWVGEE